MRCELQETSGLIDVVGSLAWSETVDWASQGYSQWLSFTGMERVGERVGECTGDVRRDHESLFEGGSLLVVVGGDTEPPGSDDVVGIDSGKKDVMGVDAALASESDRSIGERLRRPYGMIKRDSFSITERDILDRTVSFVKHLFLEMYPRFVVQTKVVSLLVRQSSSTSLPVAATFGWRHSRSTSTPAPR